MNNAPEMLASIDRLRTTLHELQEKRVRLGAQIIMVEGNLYAARQAYVAAICPVQVGQWIEPTSGLGGRVQHIVPSVTPNGVESWGVVIVNAQTDAQPKTDCIEAEAFFRDGWKVRPEVKS